MGSVKRTEGTDPPAAVDASRKSGRRQKKWIATSNVGGFLFVLTILLAFSCFRVKLPTKVLVSSIDGKISTHDSHSHLASTMPDQSMRLCWENPFAKNVNASLEEVGSAIDKWIANSTAIETSLARIVDNSKHPHTRFQAFEVMGGGCTQTDCIGGACKRDVSKIMCGSAQELKAPCVVYSIGGNNQWQFELDVLRKTPCEVHTFDCTGERERFKVPEDPRLHFHFVCLGIENKNNTEVVGMGGEFWTLEKMTETFNHTKIDLLKTDIEGYEWVSSLSARHATHKNYQSSPQH